MWVVWNKGGKLMLSLDKCVCWIGTETLPCNWQDMTSQIVVARVPWHAESMVVLQHKASYLMSHLIGNLFKILFYPFRTTSLINWFLDHGPAILKPWKIIWSHHSWIHSFDEQLNSQTLYEIFTQDSLYVCIKIYNHGTSVFH